MLWLRKTKKLANSNRVGFALPAQLPPEDMKKSRKSQRKDRAKAYTRMRNAAFNALQGMTPNQISARFTITNTRAFIQTKEWRSLRLMVLEKYGRRCMKCGYASNKPGHISVDHIKPRMFFPELALDFENLQVLCGHCNRKKGNLNCKDYRPRPEDDFVDPELPAMLREMAQYG